MTQTTEQSSLGGSKPNLHASSAEAVTVGIHIVDILGRPVTSIPQGQGMSVLDEIRMTAAGTAAATAYGLSRLGVATATFGALGNDELGIWLKGRLEREGVDTSGLNVVEEAQTSATMLPIRPDGSRPALHVPGASAYFTPDMVDLDVVAHARHIHIGGTFLLEQFDGLPTARLLQFAREHSLTTSLDLIGVPDADFEAVLGPVYPYIDYFLPNDEDALMLSGTSDVAEASRWFHDRGVGTSAITLGAQGVSVAVDGVVQAVIPAYAVDVIDTSGCGDAFSSGFIYGILDGRTPLEAAQIGVATGSAAARGLGSDAGVNNLDELEAFIAETPR